LLAPHVAGDGGRGDPLPFQPGHRSRRLLGVPGPDRHRRTGQAQGAGDAQPDAAVAAGDHRHPTGQVEGATRPTAVAGQGLIGRFVHGRSGRSDRNQPPAAPVPPSVGMVWPVTNVDRSDAKNSSTRAWSSATPIRPTGTHRGHRCTWSAGTHSEYGTCSDSVTSGPMPLTRTPWTPTCTARLRVKWTTAAL